MMTWSDVGAVGHIVLMALGMGIIYWFWMDIGSGFLKRIQRLNRRFSYRGVYAVSLAVCVVLTVGAVWWQVIPRLEWDKPRADEYSVGGFDGVAYMWVLVGLPLIALGGALLAMVVQLWSGGWTTERLFTRPKAQVSAA